MIHRAVYPGTFDPVTYGHIDLMKRALRMCDEIIVAISDNPAKSPLFTFEERKRFIEDSTGHLKGITVEYFDVLLVDYMKMLGANLVIRGVRAISDFEYEFQMALMNRALNPEIETVFLIPNEKYSFVSSRLIKEVAAFGGGVSHLVPASVAEALRQRVGKLQKDR